MENYSHVAVRTLQYYN